jgi:hypothetical protein
MNTMAIAAPVVVPMRRAIDIMPLAKAPLSLGPLVKSKKLFGV